MMDRRGVLGWFFGGTAAAAALSIEDRPPIIITKGQFVPVADGVMVWESADGQSRTYNMRKGLRFDYDFDYATKIKPFQAHLKQLAGIVSVYTHSPYELSVNKSACYSWDEIEPAVLKAILAAQGV